MTDKIMMAVLVLIPILLSLSVHEYAHGRVALFLNDRTALSQGRLTLNPIAHIDPIGTILLPMMGVLFGGFVFGWAKPVPVNPINFTRSISMKKGMLIVAAAGPISNLLLALLGSILLYVLFHVLGISDKSITTLFVIFIKLNVLLAFFNLLPIPPLDGGRILSGLLPDKYDAFIEGIERYGFMILIFLLFTGALDIIFRPVDYLSSLLLDWPYWF